MATDLEMASKLNRKFAYIFDLDGVIIDSVENYYKSLRTVFLKHFGIVADRDFFLQRVGASIPEHVEGLLAHHGIDGNKEELLKETSEHYHAIVHTGEPIVCNVQLIKMLIKNGTPVAVASGSSRRVIEICLSIFGIEGIKAIVSADEISNGKPDPESFLLAAKQLGFSPNDCVVVEDADAGAQAAFAAGMRLLRFYDTGR